jgi:putative membrane protein
MSYLTQHWSLDPFLIIVVVLVGWHEVGLAREARQAGPERTWERRRRSLWFYGGLAVLLVAVESPIDYWSYDYFFMHMVQHLLLMFAAPSMIVAGAPWQPLLDGLPRRTGRSRADGTPRGGWPSPVRAVGSWLLRPWVSVVIFNLAMLFWHVPGPLDLATSNQFVHLWLMDLSFALAGVLFWLQFIPSPPFPMRMPPEGQAVALVATNVIMWILAMAMGFLTTVSWYPVYDHIPGVTLAPFASQQIGAGILWVCGDFWAIPMLIVVVRRIIDADGSLGAALDKILGRDQPPGAEGKPVDRWASRAGRPAPPAPRP